jgi:hypothetical protein
LGLDAESVVEKPHPKKFRPTFPTIFGIVPGKFETASRQKKSAKFQRGVVHLAEMEMPEERVELGKAPTNAPAGRKPKQKMLALFSASSRHVTFHFPGEGA